MAVADLQRALDNYDKILVLLTQAMTPGATQADVDAAVAAYGSAVPSPKPSITYDTGGSIDWAGLQATVIDKMRTLRLEIVARGGPFEVRSRGVC